MGTNGGYVNLRCFKFLSRSLTRQTVVYGIRMVFASMLTATKCDGYTSLQEREAVATLREILHDPRHFEQYIRRYALSSATSVAYGRRVTRIDEPLATSTITTMTNFSKAMTPGRYAVESTPALPYLPKALAPWGRELDETHEYETKVNLDNYLSTLRDAAKHPDRHP